MIRFLCQSYLPHRWMIRWKIFHPSLDRLSELGETAVGTDEEASSVSEEFSRILQNLQLRRIWKWTGRGRLQRMDHLLAQQVRALEWESLSMLDVGASDGITSLDTVEQLRAQGIDISIVMLDREFHLKRARLGWGTVVYATSSLHPFLLRRGRLGAYLDEMQGWEGLMFNRIAACLSRRYRRILETLPPELVESISLVNPAVTRCPSIQAVERDGFLLEPSWQGRFAAVRFSNVLTRSYYSNDQIREALTLAHSYLRSGGLLVVSRNEIGEHEERESGGIWQRIATGFQRCAGLDEWPDIAPTIDGLDVMPQRNPS